MKSAALLFALIFAISGCDSPPLAEINMSGSIGGNGVTESVVSLSSSLAAQSNLKLVDQARPSGEPEHDTTISMHLQPRGGERIFVTIIGYSAERLIVIRIAGDINNPLAGEIAIQARQVFQRHFPGAELNNFERKRGFFGP